MCEPNQTEPNRTLFNNYSSDFFHHSIFRCSLVSFYGWMLAALCAEILTIKVILLNVILVSISRFDWIIQCITFFLSLSLSRYFNDEGRNIRAFLWFQNWYFSAIQCQHRLPFLERELFSMLSNSFAQIFRVLLLLFHRFLSIRSTFFLFITRTILQLHFNFLRATYCYVRANCIRYPLFVDTKHCSRK